MPVHGERQIGSVRLDAYNADLQDETGFIGDRASGRAFKAILQDERERLGEHAEDPLGEERTDDIANDRLDAIVAEENGGAAGLVIGAIEEFAHEFTTVIHRFMRLDDWHGTERIIVGGGLSSSRIGRLAIARTAVLVKGDGLQVDLQSIRFHCNEAGLIGALHLPRRELLAGSKGMVALDIGGSKARAGLVLTNAEAEPNFAEARVEHVDVWEHRNEKPGRDDAVAAIVQMVRRMIEHADEKNITLAPIVGVGCPGLIRSDGTIARGGQNLPGNWEEDDFNLPNEIRSAIPTLKRRETRVILHNDAVVQGLSEVPFMQDVGRWGVMTVGTGLGNARFTNLKST